MPDGRVRVDATISRTGVQVYHDHLGKEIREYRPEDEVFSQASIDSMQLVVVTDDHPPVFITDQNRADYERGTVLESVRREGNHLVASLLITDKALIEKMKRGKRDISLGYQCELEMTPGTSPSGEHYDAIQRLIIGNHAAVVDRGRAGTAKVRMDGLAVQHIPQSAQAQPTSGQDRADASERISTMEELQKKLGEALANAAAEKQRADEATAKATDLAAKLATAQNDARDQKARADEATAAIAKAKTDAVAQTGAAVKARVDVLTKATSVLGVNDKGKTTIKNDKGEDVEILDALDTDIMRAVVVKVDGEDVDAAMRSDASYVRAMFDGACKRASKSTAAAGATRTAIVGTREQAAKADQNPGDDEETRRKKMIKDSAEAHKQPMTNVKEGA